jgi:hypothetical protein
MGTFCWSTVLLNPFCPLTSAKVLALKATALLLLTLLIKARVQIVAGSALGIAVLLLQMLVVLAVSGALVLAAGGAALARHPTAPVCNGLIVDRALVMNPEQIQSLEVLFLAMLPVALLWWLWIRMLRW